MHTNDECNVRFMPYKNSPLALPLFKNRPYDFIESMERMSNSPLSWFVSINIRESKITKFSI